VTVEVRRATRGDIAALRRLLSISWHIVYDVHAGREAVDDLIRSSLTDRLLARQIDTEIVLVSLDPAGEIRGCLFARLSDDVARIGRLYVDPRLHRHGHGRALVAALDRLTGSREIELTVVADNTPARAFYVGEGFAEVGRTSFSFAGVDVATRVLRRPPRTGK
jgi:ribosomal protein S18 acetylase RimI-like enzyme